MNFSIHLRDELVERLAQAAKESGKTRNALIGEAIGEWLDRRRTSKWPQSVMNFRGIRGIARFEESRKELKPPGTPFGALSA
jgi:metal-responsive CopG/Arc/MetJ family transcriptional regulator